MHGQAMKDKYIEDKYKKEHSSPTGWSLKLQAAVCTNELIFVQVGVSRY